MAANVGSDQAAAMTLLNGLGMAAGEELNPLLPSPVASQTSDARTH